MAAQMAEVFPITLFDAPFDIHPLNEMMVRPRYLDGDLAHSWLRSNILEAASAIAC